MLKALAFHNRGESKDAYDLFYIVRNYGSGPEEVASRVGPLLERPDAKAAIEILRRDFTDPGHIGPRRVGEFLSDSGPEIRADVVGFMGRFLVGL